MTSMPSRTAASMERRARRIPVCAELTGDAERLVVAEVGAGGCREPEAPVRVGACCFPPLCRRRECRGRRGRGRTAPRVGVGRCRGSERPRDDHLRRRIRGLTLRKAGRICLPCRREERVRLVDSVVDDPDLHSLPCGRESRPPHGRRADDLRCLVEQCVVADTRPDLGARHA